MKKFLLKLSPLLCIGLGFTGCASADKKMSYLSNVYGTVTIISLLLLICCLIFVRENKNYIILLFSSVLVVNIGYTLLSISKDLDSALLANRIAYLGSVFLPFAMLMIILNITKTRVRASLPLSLLVLSVIVFLVAASPGILDIYYKEVSFKVVDGISTLIKVYGPLHPLYLVYLLGYFTAMIAVIVRAYCKKTLENSFHAVIIAIAVLVNIGVWFIEQISDINFEFLSVSYIISELFLLGVHMIANENRRLRELVKEKEAALEAAKLNEKSVPLSNVSAEAMEYFLRGTETLTHQERQIYEAYLRGESTKDIMAALNIKENTLKFHNKNLYGKLGVSSRKQLMEVKRAVDASENKDREN